MIPGGHPSASLVESSFIMTSRIAAFFDLDNTIVAGPAIEYPYFRLLWSRGLVGPKDLLRSAGVLLRDIPPFSFDPLRRYKAYLAGKPIEAIEAPAQYFFWEHILPRISEQARRALDQHRAPARLARPVLEVTSPPCVSPKFSSASKASPPTRGVPACLSGSRAARFDARGATPPMLSTAGPNGAWRASSPKLHATVAG